MNLATIDVPQAFAREKVAEYRAAVKARHEAEDAQILAGYRALSQGKTVIDLVATIRKGGGIRVNGAGWNRRTEFWVPRLAIMRADQKWCHVATDRDGEVRFYHQGWSPRSNERRNVVSLPAGTLPVPEGGETRSAAFGSVRALVPPVPPGLRPNVGIGSYHVLFEAEWQPVAPKDPALLKHIGGGLYVVVATWDLTELERTVLAGRFR